jgi:hypothetical protein
MDKIYVGDIGTEIILDAGQDITGATVSMAVLKPGTQAEATWPASVQAIDGASNYVRHKAVAGDMDEPGLYRVQPVITLADGSWSGRGETAEFRVYDKQK